jgi:hypothetical protein
MAGVRFVLPTKKDGRHHGTETFLFLLAECLDKMVRSFPYIPHYLKERSLTHTSRTHSPCFWPNRSCKSNSGWPRLRVSNMRFASAMILRRVVAPHSEYSFCTPFCRSGEWSQKETSQRTHLAAGSTFTMDRNTSVAHCHFFHTKWQRETDKKTKVQLWVTLVSLLFGATTQPPNTATVGNVVLDCALSDSTHETTERSCFTECEWNLALFPPTQSPFKNFCPHRPPHL